MGVELSRGRGSSCNATGNFTALKRFGALNHLFLSGCSVVGDIAALSSWPKMMYLFLSDTGAYGSISSAVKPYNLNLQEFEAARTQVTVDWSNLVADLKNQQRPRLPFPHLTRLILNDCPLNMEVDDFVAPLVMNKHISTIEVSGCGLSGVFANMRRAPLFINGTWTGSYPRYWEPKAVDLSRNQLSKVEGQPATSLVFINFSANLKLKEMDDSFLDSNIFMDLSGTPLNKESLFSSSKWKAANTLKPQANEGSLGGKLQVWLSASLWDFDSRLTVVSL